uniref:Uncharacterized protein n=1 Tax=Anguilla anguilla TaxID=7936 RepID=A0A0E9QGR3_ANGAN
MGCVNILQTQTHIFEISPLSLPKCC